MELKNKEEAAIITNRLEAKNDKLCSEIGIPFLCTTILRKI